MHSARAAPWGITSGPDRIGRIALAPVVGRATAIPTHRRTGPTMILMSRLNLATNPSSLASLTPRNCPLVQFACIRSYAFYLISLTQQPPAQLRCVR